MELWDMYNKERVKLNKTHERGKPIPEGEYHIVVDIWTINKERKILITQRHPEKHFGLLWECTGGSITVGEESIEGALRELSEEVGLDASANELELIHTICLHDSFVDTYFTCQDVKIEDLKLQDNEVVDAKFVTYQELIDMWCNGLVVPRERLELYLEKIEQLTKPKF